MKKIGLIGGLSWQSTVEYYRVINEESNRRLGGGLDTVECILYSVNLTQKLGRIAEGNKSSWGRSFWTSGKTGSCGGGCAPFVHQHHARCLRRAFRWAFGPGYPYRRRHCRCHQKQGLQKVALLGTPFTMTQPFYKGRLKQLHGIDVLLPTEEQGEEIYRVINEELTFHILKRGIPPLFSGCNRFFAGARRQGAILGCTEIPLLIQQEHTDLPVFDTTVLHAMAAVDAALA